MSMQDPIADMLTRIRNAQSANHPSCTMYVSKIKLAIAKVLKDQGYVNDFKVDDAGKNITIELKYYKGSGVISKLVRESKPGLRLYKDISGLKGSLGALGGMGILIVSTSKGIMSADNAIKQGVGGEIICSVT